MLLRKLILLPFVALHASAAPSAPDPGNLLSRDSAAATTSSCSEWYDFYGRGRWTYTQVQWCFAQQSSSTVITQEQQNPWYYWGGAWYRGGSRKLSWRAKDTVDGQLDFDSGENSNDGPAKKEIYTYMTKIQAGTYDVHLNYNQEGPYWGDDAAINQDVQFQISLGE